MVIFVTSLIILLLAGVFTLVNGWLDGWLLQQMFFLVGLDAYPKWWQQLLFFGVLYVLGFLLLSLVFIRREVRLAYDPERRDESPAYRLLHGIHQFIGCKGQWWVPFFLYPMILLHLVDIILVYQGHLSAGWWWVFAVGLFGLWGIYAFGEPTIRPKKAHPAAQPGEKEPEPADGGELITGDLVTSLRNATWYHGQITCQLSSPLPDSSPMMPTEVRIAYEKIRKLCDGQPAALVDEQPADGNSLIQSIINHMIPRPADGSLPRLYTHQEETLRLLSPDHRYDEDGKPLHVILATPIGSGRTTTSTIAALQRVLQEHKSVLVVFPDQYTGRPQAEKLQEALKESPWGWAVNVRTFWSPDERLPKYDWKEDRYSPDILITSVDFLHQYLLPDHDRWQYFLHQLDLIILENMDMYAGLEAQNAGYVFTRLKRILKHHHSNPQVLAMGSNRSDIGEHFGRLYRTGVPASGRILTADGCAHLPKTIVFWNPPLLRDLPSDPSSGALEVHRRNYFDEVRLLVAELIAQGYRPAVLTRGVPFTDMDVSQFNQSIANRIGNQWKNYDVPIGESFHAMMTRQGTIERDDPAKYTAVILMGDLVSWNLVMTEIQHLGERAEKPCDQPLVLVVTPDTPLPQYAARSPIQYLERILESNPVETAPSLPNMALLENHLLYAAREIPVSPADAFAWFGQAGKEALQNLVYNSKLDREDRQRLDTETNQIVTDALYTPRANQVLNTDLKSLGEDPWLVVERSRPEIVLTLLDRYIVRQQIHLGAVMVIRGKRYRVAEIKAREKLIIMLPEGNAYLTVPIVAKQMEPVSSAKLVKPSKRRLDPLCRREMLSRVLPVHLTATLAGYRRYDNFGFEQSDEQELDPSSVALADNKSFDTVALALSFGADMSPEAIHTIGHLLKVVLPFFLDNPPEEIGVTELQKCSWLEDHPAVVVYENVPGGNGITEWLENNLKKVLEWAYDVLVQCPCTEGCRGCVKLPDCSSMELNGGLDKLGAIRALGSVLGKNFEASVDHRLKGIDLAENLDFHRWMIVEQIFPHRLGMVIGQPADLIVADLSENGKLNLLGFYAPDRNLVTIAIQKQQDMIATLAHEYAHNWQHCGVPQGMAPTLRDEQVIPFFGGRLFVEGFAQWVEFKILDHYGFRQNVDSIVFRHYDSYGEGFVAIKWLEDQPEGGVQSVIHFITTGEVKLGNRVISLDEFLTASHVKSRLLDAQIRFQQNPPPNDTPDDPQPPTGTDTPTGE